jgi:WD40 repeat protein
VTALAVHGGHLFSCSEDGTAQVWDLQAFASILSLHHRGPVNALSVRDDLLVTGSDDHTLRLLDWRRGAELARFTDDAVLVTCGLADDSETILGGGKSGQLHILAE